MNGNAPKVFVSYSHRDASALEWLRTHLKPVVRDNEIDLWDDTRIRAGDVWRAEIDRALATVDAAVLLVSADFLASDFIHENELPPIFDAWERRGIKIYWVLLSRCNYQHYPSLRRLQAVNPGLKPLSAMVKDKREELWSMLAKAIADDLKARNPSRRTDVTTVTATSPSIHAIRGRVSPALDDGPVPLDSPFYVQRDADRQIFAHLVVPGSTVTVKGHAKSGKSSLVARLSAWSQAQGRDTCVVDFHGLNSLYDPKALLREIAHVLNDRMNLNADIDADWSVNRTHKTNLSRFVERRVLGRHDCPVLLLFDEADLVFPHRLTCDDLFSTIRFWHNERANDLNGRGWYRVGLVIAHATDPALWIRDLNQSPFNVGLRVVLEDFDTTQIAYLNDQLGCPLHSLKEVERLADLVGGHPYLVRLALYDLATHPRTLDELERVATRQDGPFASPLRLMMNLIGSNEQLRFILRSILTRKKCDDESMYQRLWAVGLIRGENRDHAMFRSRIYEDFCRQFLGNIP
ncbi:MAG TPA: AAA-like domain-containing protein, partial [Isosphaeraceae bacterium]|nr:AAA-like domain-containing protein [Isosphaeraceae bacterium]